MVRVALFSEDTEFLKSLSLALGENFEVLLERTEAGIFRLLDPAKCNVCILHLSYGSQPWRSRIDFSRRLIASQVSLIVAADEGFESTAEELVQLGANGYFCNTGNFRDLTFALQELQSASLSAKPRHQNAQPRIDPNKCNGLIGSGSLMQRVSYLVHLVADLDVSVFITGESGTGKELIARAIHSCGNRSKQPFVAVSCGAIPETLFEAELFGHERGAFTGSVGVRQGHFEEVGSGTLFLDEIGDLSLPAQVKLLRVLQEREFNRLGSNRLIPMRARMIFATHQDLDEMVAQGTFRHDLYYRLNVVKINAPPLRDHMEDIPQLVEHFLQLYSEMYKIPAVGIDPHALSLMQSHTWPGNVRELEHIIQSSLILCRGECICPMDLPAHIRGGDANVVDIRSYQCEGSFEKQIHNYKIKLAQESVRRCNGNKTVAARSLNISRAYLHRLLRLEEEGQIEEPAFSETEAV